MKIQPNPGRPKIDDIVRPEGVKAYKGQFGGYERNWREYVPECYDGSKKVPLVVSLHGGCTYHADVRFGWELLAERENFILLCPQSLVENVITWNTLEDPEGPDDVAFIDDLIQQTIDKYNIDETRIYIQGHSMGDLMTSTYICRHPERIAAAAPLSGPGPASKYMKEDGTFYRYPDRPVPLIRTHGSEDLGLPLKHPISDAEIRKNKPARPKVVWLDTPAMPKPAPQPDEVHDLKLKLHLLLNDYVWKTRNATCNLPEITVEGKRAWFYYKGPEADYLFYSVQDGGHAIDLDEIELVWDNCLSRYRRVDGKVVCVKPELAYQQDVGAVALADCSPLAYVNNQIVELGGNVPLLAYELDGTYYVPARSIPTLFPSLSVRFEDCNMTAYFSDGVNELQVALNMKASVWNGKISSQHRTLFIDSNLYVAISDIAAKFFGWKTCFGYNAAYTGPQEPVMSFDLAYYIRNILGKEPEWTVRNMIDAENEIAAARNQAAQETKEKTNE